MKTILSLSAFIIAFAACKKDNDKAVYKYEVTCEGCKADDTVGIALWKQNATSAELYQFTNFTKFEKVLEFSAPLHDTISLYAIGKVKVTAKIYKNDEDVSKREGGFNERYAYYSEN